MLSFRSVSKSYPIYDSPGDRLKELLLLNRRPFHRDFWALRDVSFDVVQGEVVGIIGRNGAGKSTLLKILTRITKPTCGRARLWGRVGSLLEVGTGFHPELTGRENVFLNGSILGMSRTEIQANFDRIVEFSGVEKFIDTPIKRYSSGMKVRLAFAVAAHLDLVDQEPRAVERGPAIPVGLDRVPGARGLHGGVGQPLRGREPPGIDVVQGDRERAVQLLERAQVGEQAPRELDAAGPDQDDLRALGHRR